MLRQILVSILQTGAVESQSNVSDFHSAETNAFSAILPSIQTKTNGLTGSKSRRLEADRSRSHRWQPEPRPSWSRLLWRLSRLAQARVRHEIPQQPSRARGLRHINLVAVL